MASIKVLLYKHKVYSSGNNPVILQFIQNGKPRKKVLFDIHPDDWDEKKCEVKKKNPFHAEMNHMISNELNRAKSVLYSSSAVTLPVNPDAVLKGQKDDRLLYCTQKAIDTKFKNLSKRSARKYITLITRITGYDPHVTVSQIDEIWLDSYVHHLERKLSRVTINKEIVVLKTILRFARKEGLSISDDALDYKYSAGKSSKPKLTYQEIVALWELQLTDLDDLARDTFLFCYYAYGMRIGDAMTINVDNLEGNFLNYKMGKNGKQMRVSINSKLRSIIDKYSGGYYLLPWFEGKEVTYKKVESRTSVMNRCLKRIAFLVPIDINLTTHIARHTFAYHADKRGVILSTLKDMLGHSSIATTDNYIRSIRKDDEIDRASDQVYG